jgi:hypothetical protein
MPDYLLIIAIILIAGFLGGYTNFLVAYNDKLPQKEKNIKLLASLFLGLCASFSVPLFLQILSNDLLDKVNLKNALILMGFCTTASYFSKRFLDDIYAKINKLDNKVDEAKISAENKIEKVKNFTENVNKKVENFEESAEEFESKNISTDFRLKFQTDSNSKYSEDQLKDVIEALASTKYYSRTVGGIAEETKLSTDTVSLILNDLEGGGYAQYKIGSDGNEYWRLLKHHVLIYSAIYSWDTGQIDVSNSIKKLISAKQYTGVVLPKTFDIIDPAYGKRKTLRIQYRIGGLEKELIRHDGETFELK